MNWKVYAAKVRSFLPTKHQLWEMLFSAGVGAIVGQLAFPSVAPNLDYWSFAALGWSPFQTQFLVIAGQDEVAKGMPSGHLLTVNRLFCGGGSTCLQVSAVIDRGRVRT